jgi:hypothetical protein
VAREPADPWITPTLALLVGGRHEAGLFSGDGRH